MNDTKPLIAVWFSSGAASAIAAKKTIELYKNTHNIRVINNPIKEEDKDNLRFLKDVEEWIECKIEFAVNTKYKDQSCVEVWEKRRFMSGPHGAPCTLELKKKARQDWEKINKPDWHVLGFTFDEKKRHERFILTERENVIPVLINEKITKKQCFSILEASGIKLPRIYRLGYPNANCIGCVKATSPTYWNHVRSKHPIIFKQRADQSRKIGAKLVRVKNKRIFLDELSPNSKGNALKNLNFECGIFCEENKN